MAGWMAGWNDGIMDGRDRGIGRLMDGLIEVPVSDECSE